MSTTSIPIADNRTGCNTSFIPASSNAPTSTIETDPTSIDSTLHKIDETNNCNKIDESRGSQEMPSQEISVTNDSASSKPPPDTDMMNNSPIKNNEEELSDERKEQNESSTFSTAFTISFEDDKNKSKKLSIKDSIRKFAPPKPHTIEKPRQTKSDQCQDNSLMSIESAPAGLSRHSNRKEHATNSSRSSSRRSNSSRHSNISESAAFLIDRMLNCKQIVDSSSPVVKSNNRVNHHQHLNSSKSPSSTVNNKNASQAARRLTHSSDDILDSEIDFWEDKSDNGTYIVGADPESEAARKKIDELFGVMKAAEASVIADSNKNRSSGLGSIASRQSRITDKKALNQDRQEHVNRLARRHNSSVSRSSSSSRQENTLQQASERQTRASSRHSRNSSCDRTPKTNNNNNHHVVAGRPRRSTSQSSRQSSNREMSDGDTRSSRSSLHNNDDHGDSSQVDGSNLNHPSMKFNRAFALRRARLGLGEPVGSGGNRVIAAQNLSGQECESIISNNINSSQRRHQINTNTYRASQSSTGTASFCRDDGGRFSLRMRNNIPGSVQSRLNSAQQYHIVSSSTRSPQHNALLEGYISKEIGAKMNANVSSQQQQLDQMRNSSQKHSNLPYQSTGDELESTISPSSRYRLLAKTASRSLQRKGPSEMESDSDMYNNRFNYSLGAEVESNESRAGSSASRQLGALDSLVISAISSLSLKIRHSICDVLVEQAKKLPIENETRLIVEEILPQLAANSSSSKSPTSIEEIDQSLYFDLANTLKNLKKVEQMVDVINLISNQLPAAVSSLQQHNNNSPSSFSRQKSSSGQATGILSRASDDNNATDNDVITDLSPA